MQKKILMSLLLLLLIIMPATSILTQDDEPILLGVQPWLGYGPWWIAEEQGFFEERGLDVEVVDFTWDQDMTAALAGGQLTVISAATNTLIALVNQDVDVEAFLILDASFEADAVIASKEIESIDDIIGLSVAYEQGATSDLLINYALNEAGYSIDDIESVPMAAADAGLALIAGRVDVAVTYEPYISAALGEDDSFGVLYTSAEKPGLISDVMIANAEWIEANPDAVEALALAWDDAVTFLRENPDEGGLIIADAVGSPLEEFQIAFEGVQVYDLEENAVALFSGEFQDSFEVIGNIMMDLNPDEITMVPSPDEIIVYDYMEAYLPEDFEAE